MSIETILNAIFVTVFKAQQLNYLLGYESDIGH